MTVNKNGAATGPTPGSTPAIVAAYDYCDEAGVLLFQSVRREPGANGEAKDFRQRRPMNGSWAWSLEFGDYRRGGDGFFQLLKSPYELQAGDLRAQRRVQTVLYRLPELLSAPPESIVWIAEGEKDVENLRALGMVATTNPMGAGKWKPHYNEALRGRKVAVLADNDDVGRKHADQVTAALFSVAASVLRVELPNLPPKGDVSDWLAAGHGPAELLALLAKAERSALGFDAFPEPLPLSQLRRADPASAWLWHGYLARGEVTLYTALWKAGKTTLLAHLLKVFGAGGHFCDRDVLPSRVLYVTEEHESMWAERRDELAIGDHADFLIRPFPGKPRFDAWLNFLGYLAALQRERRYDLVVCDTLANLWPVRDENDASLVQEALMPLRGVLESAAVLLVHHTRKADGAEATSSRGSGALPAFADTLMEFRRYAPMDKRDQKRVLTAVGRHRETPAEVVVELTATGYETCGGNRDTVETRNLILVVEGILPIGAPGLTAEQILDLWPDDEQPNRNRFYRALNQGVAERGWKCLGKGVRGSPHTYFMTTIETPFD